MARLWRSTVAILVGVVALASAPTSASAVGTGGIELTPIPAETPDGKPVKSFQARVRGQESKTLQFALRNVIDAPATADVYAASAVRSTEGRFAVGSAGSAPWIGLDRQTVTLAPKEQRVVTFTVTRNPVTELPVSYGAIVVEVARGAVVGRAATIVAVRPVSGDRGILVDVAFPLAVLVMSVGILAVFRRRRAAKRRGAAEEFD